MSSLTPNPVSLGDGDGSLGRGVAVLDYTVHRSPLWCANCAGPQEFIEVFHIAGVGRVGFCWGCGEERIVPFSRVNSEAA